MIKMTFEVAKAMQPAVIYVNNVDMVFKSKKKPKKDKKKTAKKSKKAIPGSNKIRKELEAQVAALTPGQRVLCICETSDPAEAEGFTDFFDRMIYTPIPDYGSCQTIWKSLIEKKIGGPVPQSLDISTLAYICNGYPSGIVRVLLQLASFTCKILTNFSFVLLNQ